MLQVPPQAAVPPGNSPGSKANADGANSETFGHFSDVLNAALPKPKVSEPKRSEQFTVKNGGNGSSGGQSSRKQSAVSQQSQERASTTQIESLPIVQNVAENGDKAAMDAECRSSSNRDDSASGLLFLQTSDSNASVLGQKFVGKSKTNSRPDNDLGATSIPVTQLIAILPFVPVPGTSPTLPQAGSSLSGSRTASQAELTANAIGKDPVMSAAGPVNDGVVSSELSPVSAGGKVPGQSSANAIHPAVPVHNQFGSNSKSLANATVLNPDTMLGRSEHMVRQPEPYPVGSVSAHKEPLSTLSAGNGAVRSSIPTATLQTRTAGQPGTPTNVSVSGQILPAFPANGETVIASEIPTVTVNTVNRIPITVQTAQQVVSNLPVLPAVLSLQHQSKLDKFFSRPTSIDHSSKALVKSSDIQTGLKVTSSLPTVSVSAEQKISTTTDDRLAVPASAKTDLSASLVPQSQHLRTHVSLSFTKGQETLSDASSALKFGHQNPDNLLGTTGVSERAAFGLRESSDKLSKSTELSLPTSFGTSGWTHAPTIVHATQETIAAIPLSTSDAEKASSQVQSTLKSMHGSFAKSGPTEVTVHLHPHDWGQVQIKVETVSTSDGASTVRAHIVAENASVKDALQKHVAELKSSLVSAGISVDDISVSVRVVQPGQASAPSSGEHHGNHHNGNAEGGSWQQFASNSGQGQGQSGRYGPSESGSQQNQVRYLDSELDGDIFVERPPMTTAGQIDFRA